MKNNKQILKMLTVKDIELIVNIDKDTDNEEAVTGKIRSNEDHYATVLSRYYEAVCKQIEGVRQPKFQTGDIIVCHSMSLRSLYGKKAIVVNVNEKDGFYRLRMTEGDETIGISFTMEEYFGLWESHLFRVREPEVKDLLELIKTIYRDFGRQDLISEAVDYLRDNKDFAVKTEDNGISGWITDEFIEQYKQYLFNKTKNVRL